MFFWGTQKSEAPAKCFMDCFFFLSWEKEDVVILSLKIRELEYDNMTMLETNIIFQGLVFHCHDDGKRALELLWGDPVDGSEIRRSPPGI